MTLVPGARSNFVGLAGGNVSVKLNIRSASWRKSRNGGKNISELLPRFPPDNSLILLSRTTLVRRLVTWRWLPGRAADVDFKCIRRFDYRKRRETRRRNGISPSRGRIYWKGLGRNKSDLVMPRLSALDGDRADYYNFVTCGRCLSISIPRDV